MRVLGAVGGRRVHTDPLPYSEQWARLGNAVPPLMMRAIAEAIRDGILKP